MISPEWSHRIPIDTIADEPLNVRITASEQQRRDLCRRLRVSDIKDLSADVTIERRRGSHIYHVFGSFSAKVTQPCVVTLEPVTENIAEEFESWFTQEQEQVVSFNKARREREGLTTDAELQIMEEHEDPELIEDSQIDVGEVISQFLSLSITAYPHKEGVEYGGDKSQDEKPASSGRPNPFAALKDWKFSKNKDNK